MYIMHMVIRSNPDMHVRYSRNLGLGGVNLRGGGELSSENFVHST